MCKLKGSATRSRPVGPRGAGAAVSPSASDTQLLRSQGVHAAIERRDLAQAASEAQVGSVLLRKHLACDVIPRESGDNPLSDGVPGVLGVLVGVSLGER